MHENDRNTELRTVIGHEGDSKKEMDGNASGMNTQGASTKLIMCCFFKKKKKRDKYINKPEAKY